MKEFDSMIQPKYELNLIQFLIETHKASDQTSSGINGCEGPDHKSFWVSHQNKLKRFWTVKFNWNRWTPDSTKIYQLKEHTEKFPQRSDLIGSLVENMSVWGRRAQIPSPWSFAKLWIIFYFHRCRNPQMWHTVTGCNLILYPRLCPESRFKSHHFLWLLRWSNFKKQKFLPLRDHCGLLFLSESFFSPHRLHIDSVLFRLTGKLSGSREAAAFFSHSLGFSSDLTAGGRK